MPQADNDADNFTMSCNEPIMWTMQMDFDESRYKYYNLDLE